MADSSSSDEDFVPPETVESIQEEEAVEETEQERETRKRKIDSIWAELNATNIKKPTHSAKCTVSEPSKKSKISNKAKSRETKISREELIQIARAANSAVKALPKEEPRIHQSIEPSKGLDAVIAELERKNKATSLQHTSNQWDKFKKDAGIEHELEEYRQNGYLDKQDFLHDADWKQFEQEKKARERMRLKEQAKKNRSR